MQQTTISDNCIVSIQKVGGVDLVIIDNLLAHPDELRNFALDAYQRASAGSEDAYGKLRSLQHLSEIYIKPSIYNEKFESLDQKIEQAALQYVKPNVQSYFNLSEDHDRLYKFKGRYFHAVHDVPVLLPHVDSGHVSTFLYLNKPDACWGGTAIYRHLPTNTLTTDQTKTQLDWLNQTPLKSPLNRTTDEWKLETVIEMKYNRLVLFNSSVIHKIHWPDSGCPYDESIQKNRLTLNNFYYFINQEQQRNLAEKGLM